MWTQVAIIAVSIALVIYLLRASRPSAISAGKKAGLILLALAMIVTVLNPALTTTVAHQLGVGRGADLLLYAVTVTFVVYALSQYANRQSDRTTIHKLARRVTLIDAIERYGTPPTPPAILAPDTRPNPPALPGAE